jgi:hypothetical protein
MLAAGEVEAGVGRERKKNEKKSTRERFVEF